MGRRKGSRNKAQPGVEGVGANGGEPHQALDDMSDDQRRALLVVGCVEIERRKVVIESLETEIKKERSKLRTLGFNLKAELNEMLDLRKKWRTGKMGEYLEELKLKNRVARWCNVAADKPPDLFSQQDYDIAYEEGKTAGAEGLTCKPPDHLRNDGPDSPAQGWISGWQAMQTAMLQAGIKPPEPEPENPVKVQAVVEHDDNIDVRPDFLRQRDKDAAASLAQPDSPSVEQ